MNSRHARQWNWQHILGNSTLNARNKTSHLTRTTTFSAGLHLQYSPTDANPSTPLYKTPFPRQQSLSSTQKQSLDSKNKTNLEIPFGPFLPTPPRLSSRKHLNFWNVSFLPWKEIVQKPIHGGTQSIKFYEKIQEVP